MVGELSFSTAFFVGADLKLLLTTKHSLVPEGRVPDEITIDLKCDSRGMPPTYGFEGTLQAKVEVQGRFNLEGYKEFPEEDMVVLRIIKPNAEFINFTPFSFTFGGVPDHFGNLKRKIAGDLSAGIPPARLGALSIPHILTDFTGAEGREIHIDTDQLLRSDDCKIYRDLGGIWTNDCAVLPGSSGGAVYIQGRNRPILVGIISQGLTGLKPGEGLLYQADNNPDGAKNRFIPLQSMQRLVEGGLGIKGNPELWEEILEAESAGFDRRTAPVKSAAKVKF